MGCGGGGGLTTASPQGPQNGAGRRAEQPVGASRTDGMSVPHGWAGELAILTPPVCRPFPIGEHLTGKLEVLSTDPVCGRGCVPESRTQTTCH